jgi:hypothetical protein
MKTKRNLVAKTKVKGRISASKWLAERWIALAALLVAASSFFVSAWSAYSQRDYLKRSNAPYLQVGFYFDHEGSGFRLSNSGLGLANLKWFQIYADLKPQENFASMLASLGFDPLPEFEFGRPGSKFAPSSSSKIFWLAKGSADEKLRRDRDRIRLMGCFCSIFDECWVFHDKLLPSSVASCEPIPETIFGGSAPARPVPGDGAGCPECAPRAK